MLCKLQNPTNTKEHNSVSKLVELPGAGFGRMITINSKLNGATQSSEAAKEAGRASVKILEKIDFQHQFSISKIVKMFQIFFSYMNIGVEEQLLSSLKTSIFEILYLLKLTLNFDRGSSSLCSSLRGVISTIQLRINSSQPAQSTTHNRKYFECLEN